MFKFTLNFLKINWSLRDIFILCKQVSELKENIVISMSFLTDDHQFSQQPIHGLTALYPCWQNCLLPLWNITSAEGRQLGH